MEKKTTRFFCAGVLLLLVSLALVGPVSAATTITSLPYTITIPGVYELGKDFENFAGPKAIEVRASDVIIDGLGFKLDGVDNPNSVGIWASTYWQNGIDYESANVTVQNMKVSDFAHGVLIYQAQGATVTGTTFTSNTNAVNFQVVRNSRISSNTFSGNGNGVTLWATTNTGVNDNTFTMDGITGLTVGSTSSESMIRDNRFTSDMLAILLDEGSTTATIKGNQISATAAGDALKTGIQIARSSGNTIYNNIFDTYNNVKVTNTANVWSVAGTGPNIVGGPSIGGNAWMMPNGAGFSQINPDTNHDGFVDITYYLTSKNQDFLPLSLSQPAAAFVTDVIDGTAPLTVTFTDTSSGFVTGWKWNFGDGNISTEQNPTHTYFTPDHYSVKLTASSASGSNSLTKTDLITVLLPPPPALPPVANFTTNVTEGTAPLTVKFTDTSSGDVTGREWDFGDGASSIEQNPIHTYSAARHYTVNLTARGPGGSNSLVKADLVTVQSLITPDPSQTVSPPPETTRVPDPTQTVSPPVETTRAPNPTPAVQGITAGFYAFGHVGQAPFSVRFRDLSTGSPTAWRWDFGDGTTSTEQNPTHLFTSNGAYTVALTASSNHAIDTATQYRCVIVNSVPVANFTANTTSGRPGLTIQFTDLSTGESGCQWQFGDGTTSTEEHPVHVYAQPGVYTVTLAVSAPDYGSVFIQKPGYITVSDPPTVGFSANITEGVLPLAVQFNESTNGQIQYFYWQFGDGSTSYDQNPIHRYDTVGTYNVSLMAIGPAGTQVKTMDRYITVNPETNEQYTNVTPTPTVPPLPEANFTVTSGPGSFTIQVVDTSVNATSVRYDLGDDTTTAYPNFRYCYWQAGTFTIEQTATNAAGSTRKAISVTVPAAVPPTTTTVSPTVKTGQAYNGLHTLPGVLQAEDYDLGGEGVAYHDTTRGNEGGTYRQDDVDIEVLDTDKSPNVGWIRAGEWLAYSVNVSTAGTYNAGFRVASSHAGSLFQVYLDDGTTPVGTVNVPNTGDWPVFQTVSVPVTLPAGQHWLKLTFPTDYVNINWISFARNGGV